MRAIIAVAILSVFSVSLLNARGAERQTDTIACAPQDAFGDAFRDWAVRIADGADSTAKTRAVLGIPALPDTAIVWVTDPNLCDTAARHHAIQARQDTVSPPPVHLLRLGTYRYVAFNGASAGEFSKYFVYDQSFNFKLVYGM